MIMDQPNIYAPSTFATLVRISSFSASVSSERVQVQVQALARDKGREALLCIKAGEYNSCRRRETEGINLSWFPIIQVWISVESVSTAIHPPPLSPLV